jgi:hypothetical protein
VANEENVGFIYFAANFDATASSWLLPGEAEGRGRALWSAWRARGHIIALHNRAGPKIKDKA